jgi:hypothetical protein
MITQEELDAKYPEDTPYWRKDAIEWYTCTKHGRPTVLIRDADVVVHGDSETKCS